VKVLHVIPSLSHVHGGPSKAIALMEQALTARGVTLETATTDDDGPGRRNGKSLGRPLAENGVSRWYFAKRLEFYKVSPSFGRWIFREVSRYDLVHIHALFSFTSTIAAWAARSARVPYIIRPLGTLGEYGMRQRRPWAKELSLQVVERRLLRNAAAVHFTSNQESAEARNLRIPMKEVVIPLGVEVASASRAESVGLARPGPCLLFLSRLDPKKNVEGLLGAVCLLKNGMPGLRLIVAGAGSAQYVDALKARSQALGIADSVSWLGHVEGAAKAEAFAAADIFVLPSYSENFGIAAAEALAAGLPCVLGKNVAIADHVALAEAGLAVEIDAKSVADALRRIVENEGYLGRMSARARQLALDRFSVQAMGVRLEQLYSDILDR
jgi:glycosyltransferase involved in cell wall biosynthesis